MLLRAALENEYLDHQISWLRDIMVISDLDFRLGLPWFPMGVDDGRLLFKTQSDCSKWSECLSKRT